jgi:tetratricopeptide (TPR) repeat protein
MKYVFLIFSFLFASAGLAQDVNVLLDRASGYTRQGDYANATVVLNQAMMLDRDNTAVSRELAYVLYLQKDYGRALSTIKPIIDKKDADIKVFQVAGWIYGALEEGAEADKLYKKALKKFPNSGVLYSDYGEMLWEKQDYSAIRQWEKGMETDPNYPGNYYHASRYYYFTMDKVWSLIYGEIFVNMESRTSRTVEIKNILLNGYKKLFSDNDMMKNQAVNNEFVVAFLNTIKKESAVLSVGITPESLTMLRTRFILDWDAHFASRFPFRLFEYHRQLLKEGIFEAYNQWLFGSVQNLTAFQTWINTHSETYQLFTNFHQGRIFKMNGQLYQGK